ncbi:calcium-binding protein [Stagnihabitans tardus]|uniref:calcium-binding protein n=1 Tax=Stagnihabitans tardus TaxID=2699202 RepID=UPI00338DC83A
MTVAVFTYATAAEFNSYDVLIGASILATGRTATSFSYQSATPGVLITVTGTGFTYGATGKPLTGTISQIVASEPSWGGTFTISGLSLGVGVMVNQLLGFFGGTPSTTAQAEAFQVTIRAGNDTVNHVVDYGRSIAGYLGNDLINDGAGDSGLYGGVGNDTLNGGAGDDLLDGGVGADRLDGGAGLDLVSWLTLAAGVRMTGKLDPTGTFLAEVVTGSGTDQVYRAEQFELTNYNDTMIIQPNSAAPPLVVWGMDGNDSLVSSMTGTTQDTLYGGDGDDTLRGADVADGGDGRDEITANYLAFWSADTAWTGIRYDTSSGVINDGFFNWENKSKALLGVYGSKLADQMTARSIAMEFYGNEGNDTLTGGWYGDTLYGGEGNDSLSGGLEDDVIGGGAGVDTIDGGAGWDELVMDDTDVTVGVRVDLAAGRVLNDGFGSIEQVSGIEAVSGTILGDTLLGDALDNVFWGFSGNDSLEGRGGWDELYGGLGNDTLWGGDGDDTVMGGKGRDAMGGGAGNDLLAFWNEDDGAKHAVSVNLSLASGQVLKDGYGNVETVFGFEQVAGTLWNDTIVGGSGSDTIWGNEGNDTLRGFLGNDILIGGEGNDLLSGGQGQDELWGWEGVDTLEGLSGADLFVLNSTGADVVLDFAAGVDELQLWRFASDLGLDAYLAAARFGSGAGMTSAATTLQRVVYNTTTGDIYIDSDGLGGIGSVLVARLTNLAALTASDIWIG